MVYNKEPVNYKTHLYTFTRIDKYLLFRNFNRKAMAGLGPNESP